MKKIIFVFSTILFSLFSSANAQQVVWDSTDAACIPRVIFDVTKTMIRDITDPCVSSRYYTYICLAGYEAVSEMDNDMPSMHGLLHQYPLIKSSQHFSGKQKNFAALYTMAQVAENVLPSGERMEDTKKNLITHFSREGLSKNKLNEAISFANALSEKMVTYANEDGYFKLSTYTHYIISSAPGHWHPTPPGYFPAVQPNWNTLRTFFLDSAQQFKPARPTPFDTTKGSAFYKLAYQVYENANTQPEAKRAIAQFWDCNPFAIDEKGHMMIGFKKITPGGHWIAIVGVVSQMRDLSFDTTMQLHALVSVALADAFISCWDEKYRSDRIRPETVINQYIDESWRPFLQTPPFPEYSSGHECISTSASHVLTYLMGDNFAFRDTTEDFWDLQPRNFHSFIEASQEAGMSRFYGGIHFMDSIINGMEQGKNVGEYFVEKLKAFGIKPLENDMAANK